MGVHAWEPTTADVRQDAASAQPSQVEAVVTIAPVPLPATVTTFSLDSPKSTRIKQSRKAKAVKVARAKSMLSRSAREQIAIANSSSLPDGRVRIAASNDGDADASDDQLDLHRSFSQPRVAKASDQADDDEGVIDLPDHVKLRLLMARTKAVESHILNQIGNTPDSAEEELSATVKLRLYIARVRAVAAHREKYGSS
jgi:hypothetical protein